MLALLGHLIAEQRARPLGAQRHDRTLRQRAVHVRLAHPARARRLDDELRREPRGVLGDVRVDAFLPAVRALGAQPEPLGRVEDAVRLEVRRLEQHRRRRLLHLGLLAAHDRRESDRALAVLDHEVARVELAQLAVERADLLAVARAPHSDLAAGERVGVEGVERTAEREHDVVRHVDDVGDRAHPGGGDARAQPERRRPDRDVAEEAREVPRAASGSSMSTTTVSSPARAGSTPGHGASATSKSAATSRASP